MALLDFLNRKHNEEPDIVPVLPKDIYKQGSLDLIDTIAPTALKIGSRELELGEKFVRAFYTISYPRFLADSWFSPVINLDKVLDVSLFIHPIETEQALRGFQKKVAEIQSQINEREAKGLVRDPLLDASYQNIETLRDQLQQAEERIFDVGLYLALYGDTKEEIDKTEGDIRGILDAKLVYTKPALFQQEQGFRSCLPLGTDELLVNSKLNSSPLSSIFPFVSFDLTSDRGILYGINRHNSSLILFDRFSLENYNSVVFAKSGAGKSYAMKLEILRSLMFGTDVIVIDPEHEYEQLAEATGGRSFHISLSSEHHINPFDLPPVKEDEDPKDILRSNIIALVGLFRIMLSGLSPEEDAIVDRAVSETYALKDITGDADFTGAEPPLLSDFEQVLSGMEGSESLIQRLSKYTRGTWAGFLNQPTNIDIKQQFAVFSVRDMEDELKPVAMYIVTHYIWNAVRHELKKRLLVIDEAWWMMKSDDTASFLYSLAKRGRKYYLGVATITQEVEDFLNSQYGRAILNNSSLQLLMKQSTTTIDVLQKTFKLTEEEKYLLLEAGVGEGLFFAGLKHVAIKVVASYTEDQIITSDPSQLLAIQQEKERHAAEKK
ncbi:conjugal transfer protein TraC [Candidatus Kaiserbacteria bacterium RIFCSPLOWO2_01_FULL_52_12b]|uniref:Conjugal transfer protein TraC n=1 Tax=Candidatus Kaiserbacteria bacterium RIFCSPLOWO2_01_FULL_52_12b TaxID=1798509 RepID=A0A1F6EWT3_9BACT|nr:MAG: conjugal transfer protein TraC [Candidatus Kaiserbacteria bacterium RIFCSPLOWO2_01_FULL_52_12b]